MPPESRRPITAAGAPEAVGPYSHAVRHGGILYCSGMLPIDPVKNELDDASPGVETRRCLQNLKSVCAAAETDLSNALRLTIYTTRLDLFAEINAAYGAFFDTEDPPARVTVGVASLPRGATVEIDAIVAIS